MAVEDKYRIIKDRRHEKIKAKEEIWTLMEQSYVGGLEYIRGNNLFEYPRESKASYKIRLKRSVYLNHYKELIDTLAGFIFANPITRDIPTKLQPLTDRISKGSSMDSFMSNAATQCLQFTIGILVDSPVFDTDIVKTLADQKALGLQPYACIYYPKQIRDFETDDNGELLWILLDNSHCDKTDPFSKPVENKIYRLWTRENFYDFAIDKEVTLINQFNHNLGIVPFKFLNSRDQNQDLIGESSFEDIAIIERKIYNDLSLMDETLFSGTFKVLFYGCDKPKDLKDEIPNAIGNLSVIGYPKDANMPDFRGPGVESIDAFLNSIKFFIQQMFSNVGMDKDMEKLYPQSGKAKDIEFEKCEALLRSTANQLEEMEEFIYETCALWMGEPIEIKIEYQKKFSYEDIDTALTRLYQAMTLPLEAIKKEALKQIVGKTFQGMDSKQYKDLLKQVTSEMEKTTPVDTTNLANQESQNRKQTNAQEAIKGQNDVSN